jgi:hypothetical protein
VEELVDLFVNLWVEEFEERLNMFYKITDNTIIPLDIVEYKNQLLNIVNKESYYHLYILGQ